VLCTDYNLDVCLRIFRLLSANKRRVGGDVGAQRGANAEDRLGRDGSSVLDKMIEESN
jgi:hypothetical protein